MGLFVHRVLLAVAFALAPMITGTPAAHASTQTGPCRAQSGATTGTIVPLYTYPDTNWSALRAAHDAHPGVPVIAVVNLAHPGGPGTGDDAVVRRRIADLVCSGIEVSGYVDTRYLLRPLSEVRAEISTWKRSYPVTGIFLDQMADNYDHGNPNSPELSQAQIEQNADVYRGLTGYAHRLGLWDVIGNPGVASSQTYLDRNAVDIMVTREGRGVPDVAGQQSWWWMGKPALRDRTALLSYGVAAGEEGVQPLSGDQLSRLGGAFGWIYVTDRDGANPWEGLSSYFDSLLAALSAG
ncbi:spherulation-specific family 4 protein [Actinomadura scrupuli]|uniref:spherulation-specific family 4 protein n=1 Tax=Actinomadura scrupuli TaxID=559629 RepID=UPI003D99FCE9